MLYLSGKGINDRMNVKERQKRMTTLYCGTYAEGGIYKIGFSEGRFGPAEMFCEIDSPKYLCRGDSFLVTLCKTNGKGGVAVIDENGSIVDELGYEDSVPCHVMYQGGSIATSNFHEGTFCLLSFENSRLQLLKKVEIRDKAGCHMLLPYGDMLLGFALYMDRIYVFDRDLNCVREIVFPEGSGPRHGVFSGDGRYLYVVSELSNELFILKSGCWEIVDRVQLIDDPKSTSAAIRLFNGRLYVSVRGRDRVYEAEIVNEKLRVSACYDCGGSHPRDMIVVQGYAVCANRFTDSLSCVSQNGVIDAVTVPQAVSVIEF